MDRQMTVALDRWLTTAPDELDEWGEAKTFDAGWDCFYNALPVGAVIRSNEAMAGWLAARADAQAVDVDYE